LKWNCSERRRRGVILFELVICGIGLQCRVWDKDCYGRNLTYFEINGGSKSEFPFAWLSKMFHHFNFNISFRQNMYGYDFSKPKPKALDIYLFGWCWRKEFVKKGEA
jgi:hypothetical protein